MALVLLLLLLLLLLIILLLLLLLLLPFLLLLLISLLSPGKGMQLEATNSLYAFNAIVIILYTKKITSQVTSGANSRRLRLIVLRACIIDPSRNTAHRSVVTCENDKQCSKTSK